MAHFEAFFFPSSTGKNQIHALRCLPEGEIRGVVQIAHGIAEHIERYRDFMAFLAQHGFVVVGNDHLGHGKSIASEAEQGVFCPEDGWNHVVQDMVTLHDMTAKEYPGKYILFGHSMGSFLTRTYLADFPGKYDMAILSGTGHQGTLLVEVGCLLGQAICAAKGYASDGTKLSNLTMGSYLKRIENPRTPFDWLSRDAEQVDRYAADERCGFVTKAGVYSDMLQGIRYITKRSTAAKMDLDKPVYFMSGSEDPVGEYGSGVRRAYESFRRAGVKDLSIRLYEGGRHEMLNETNRDEVYADILNWIEARC